MTTYLSHIPRAQIPAAGDLSILVTLYDDNTGEVAVRPADSNLTWSPPSVLEATQ